MIEILIPEYQKQLLENNQSLLNTIASQLRWLYFDDASRLVTRVGYIDDGYVRVRDTSASIDILDMLRAFSWTFYNLSEMSRNIDLIKNALESVGTDRLRVVGNLTFDPSITLNVNIADSRIILPIEKKSNYKIYFTIYSGTVAASGSTYDIDVNIYSGLEIMLKVTAVSGTNPTLDFYVEGKFEATGDYKPLAYQTGITTTGIWYFTITQLMFRYIRARWVVGGTTPSFTIGVYAQGLV
jgi:hypothetical protein